MLHFVSSRALRDVRNLHIAVLRWSGWTAQSTRASSLLPATLTHPWDNRERSSTWCDPYSLAAKRARGGEGGAAERWVEYNQWIEESCIYCMCFIFLSVYLKCSIYPSIYPAPQFPKDYIHIQLNMLCRKHNAVQITFIGNQAAWFYGWLRPGWNISKWTAMKFWTLMVPQS